MTQLERRLPLFDARQRELELCAYCPKLCRAACPVSDADPRETVTPWGKMTEAWLVARGDHEATASFAAPAWACTGCHACRERCDHENPVAATLLEARADLFDRGVAPEAAARVAATHAARDARFAEAAATFADARRVAKGAPVALLVGCGYARPELRAELDDAVYAASELAGAPAHLVDACCGAPLAAAGDRAGFRRAAERARARGGAADRWIVLDPGCAMTMRAWPSLGVSAPAVELLVEMAARALGALAPVTPAPEHAVRWHDPCQLGRGLGVYEAPRQVLGRLLSRAPEEFPRRREGAACSGAGGLLPVTAPETSRDIAADRIAEHAAAGAGEIVTACASSLRRFRASGARASDLVSWIARGLGAEPR